MLNLKIITEAYENVLLETDPMESILTDELDYLQSSKNGDYFIYEDKKYKIVSKSWKVVKEYERYTTLLKIVVDNDFLWDQDTD